MQKVSEKQKSAIFYIAFILFAARILFLILKPLFIGIANNGDFYRLIATVGLDYPVDISIQPFYSDTFFNWVTKDYIYTEPIDTGWRQVFAIFPQFAVLLSRLAGGETFDIRFMGIVNAAFYFLAVFFVIKLIEKIDSAWSYVLLVLSLVVLGDTYVIQYFNSFYTEIGSITFLLLLWVMQIYGFFHIKNTSRIKQVIYILGYSLVAFFAIMSKQQDILIILPFLLTSYLLFRAINLRKRYFCVWGMVFLCCVGGWTAINKSAENITTFNVISKDLLAYSENPEIHLRAMGFSEEEIPIIKSGIGENAFTCTTYEWLDYSDKFTRLAEVGILLREPSIFFEMAAERMQTLFLDEVVLGNYTKASGAEAMEKTQENRLWYNLKTQIYVSSAAFYLGHIGLAVFFAVRGNKIRALCKIPKELFWVYFMILTSNVLRLVTVLLGDASHDDKKHFFATNFEFDVIFICNVICLCMIVAYYFRKNIPKSRL